MKIAFACDHGGFDLKEPIINHLKERDFEVLDLGTDSHESVDYPEFGAKAAHAVADGQADLGIIVCGTGIGISIAANKVEGIRCAAVSEPYSARMSRRHNNANMLALGSRVVGSELALMIVDEFLDNSFEGDRHERRVNQLKELDQGRDSCC